MEEKLGKLDPALFEQFIRHQCGATRDEVRVGPQFGVDVAIIDLPGELALAVTSDPLSLIPSLGLEESAWLSVQLMANDMATTGFAPMYGQFVLNLPATFSKSDFQVYWSYIDKFCQDLGLAITGGHTGFIEGQNSTIAGGGTFFTVAPKSQLLVSSHAGPGDSILVTKEAALSATAILALSFPKTIQNKLGMETHQDACRLFYETSSLQDALAAAGRGARHPDVTAMHDVTEGGLLGAIYELAVASGNGAVVYREQLPIGRAQQAVGDLFAIDPLYCVGAGAMIISCKPGTAPAVIERLRQENIACVEVGQLQEQAYGLRLVDHEQEKEFLYLKEDPYWAAFFKAYAAGWK